MALIDGVLAAAGVLAVAGCAPAAGDGGPLHLSGEPATVCAPLPDYAEAAFGVNLPNGLPADLVIDAVDPVDAEHVVIGGVYLMPVTEEYRLMLDAFPPTDQFPDAWRDAVPALGEELPGGPAVDLVIEVVADGPAGSLDGIAITYSTGGRTYVERASLALELTQGGCR